MTVPRRFYLLRNVDVTGASGTGHVADGVLWPDGTVSTRWRGDDQSFANWDDFAGMCRKSLHDGATGIVWLDQDQAPVDNGAPCAHCDPLTGHREPSHGSWGVRVGPERDSDGQPIAIRIERSNGAHVADVDAQWIRSLIDNAQETGR